MSDTTGWDYDEYLTDDEFAELDEGYADLIDLCGYFGVSERTVFHLRRMGYTYDEIEEYLFSADDFDDDDDEGFYNFCGEI